MKRKSVVLTLIKLGFAFILPFSLLIDRSVGYACLLFKIGDPLLGVAYNTSTEDILAMVLFLLYIFPSLLFNYKLDHSSDNKSIAKYLAAAITFGFPFIPILMTEPFIIYFAWGNYGSLSLTEARALLAAQWGFFLFVVLPFLLHESGKFRQEQDRTSPTKPTRYDLIAIVLGICICFLPFVISFGYISYPHTRFQVMLLSGMAIYQYTPLIYSTLSVLLAIQVYFPLSYITSIVTLYFAYYVLKYLQGAVTRSACLLRGLVSLILTPSMIAIANLYPYGFLAIPFPLPLTLIIGTVILFVAKPRILASEDVFLENCCAS